MSSQDSDFRGLTFTGLGALEPGMVKPRVAGISALIEPSTAVSATTAFPGILGDAALEACGAGFYCDRRRCIGV